MTNKEKIIKTNQDLVFILGMSLPLILDYKADTDSKDNVRKWLIESIEAVVYKDEALPPLRMTND